MIFHLILILAQRKLVKIFSKAYIIPFKGLPLRTTARRVQIEKSTCLFKIIHPPTSEYLFFQLEIRLCFLSNTSPKFFSSPTYKKQTAQKSNWKRFGSKSSNFSNNLLNDSKEEISHQSKNNSQNSPVAKKVSDTHHHYEKLGYHQHNSCE